MTVKIESENIFSTSVSDNYLLIENLKESSFIVNISFEDNEDLTDKVNILLFDWEFNRVIKDGFQKISSIIFLIIK